ncbi:MAG: hypothetical protein OXC30_00500 [Alphaproteobacteria bacterium]|nr:hypothetical protein [Alphaproteobacteria bacterium]
MTTEASLHLSAVTTEAALNLSAVTIESAQPLEQRCVEGAQNLTKLEKCAIANKSQDRLIFKTKGECDDYFVHVCGAADQAASVNLRVPAYCSGSRESNRQRTLQSQKEAEHPDDLETYFSAELD